jgi:hypothetical protein
MENLIENTVETTPVNVTINLSAEFLNADLRDQIANSSVHEATFKHIEAIAVKDRTTDQKIYFFQYKEEVKRLKNNSASIISKSKKKAEELGITLEEYRESIKDQKGGGRANEYLHEAHYAECDEIFKTKKINTLSSDEKLFWYEVRDEQKRHKACLASKKSILKKKSSVETEAEVIID